MTMANGASTQNRNDTGKKKMDFKAVEFDVNEITPDAPEGEWLASIPRGKIKVMSTREDKFPMVIVPLRLDKTEQDGEIYEKALGAELALMLVFFDNTKARAARMSKLRIRQLCEAADVDLETVPTNIRSEEDFADFIAALEGKKFTIWTKHVVRKDTGETVVEVQLQKPGGVKLKGSDDDDDDEDEDDRPARSTASAKKKSRR